MAPTDHSIFVSSKSRKPAISLNKKRVFFIGLLLSCMLVFIQFSFCKATNSLLLFNIGLLQAGISLFLFLTLITSLTNNRLSGLRLGFIFSLISGFVLSLSTGFTFIEIYTRFSEPVSIQSLDALMVSLTILAGNLLLIKLLVRIGKFKLNTGSLKLSFNLMVKVSALVFLTLLIVHFTNFYVLDTLLGFMIGLPILLLATFIMIDAYWKLKDLL